MFPGVVEKQRRRASCSYIEGDTPFTSGVQRGERREGIVSGEADWLLWGSTELWRAVPCHPVHVQGVRLLLGTVDNVNRVELNTPQTAAICTKVAVENVTEGTDPTEEDSPVDIELKEAAWRVGVGRVQAVYCQLNL